MDRRHSSGPEDILSLGGSIGHSDSHGPSSSMFLRLQHGYRWQPKTWASLWPLMVTWAMDINIDPSCRGTKDPDVILGSSLVQMSPWL